MKPNPDFEARAKKLFKLSDTLLVMCCSGERSAKAVDRLAETGFKHVYNIINGMEGDAVDDPQSVFHGKRKNGWKNSGLPWTCDLDPREDVFSDGAKKQRPRPNRSQSAGRGRLP